MKLVIFYMAIMVSVSACDVGFKSRDPHKYPENPKGYSKVDVPTTHGNWFLKDAEKDGFEGLGSDRAIAQYDLKNERQIIVAVIDSGVDVNHEDLKGKIWQNPGETGADAKGNDKATNKVDDDGNGYIDDIYGWNFLGGPDGKHIENETLEMTREMVRFDKRIAAGEILTSEEKNYYSGVEKVYTKEKNEVSETLKTMEPEEKKVVAFKAVLKEKLNLEDFSKEALEKIESKDSGVNEAKSYLLEITTKYRSVDRFGRVFENAKNAITYFLNKEFNPRTAIVGDDPDDFSQIHYGNNDVGGPDASHGTHVSGIIAATRGNGVGMDGIAENVKIMVLRAVPNGDERDKDIALSVRYAVDNGANIINMSFGKGFSPSKSMVDAAFLYASEKGVLVIHAAGNDSKNLDVEGNFQNRRVKDAEAKNLSKEISTWIEIGASSKDKGLNLVAKFSNYGKSNVDIFSPGVELNSTIPDNKYAVFSGTSMASPAAAGAAALLMSNFANMTAVQAKAIMLNQKRVHEGLSVRLPGSDKLDLPVLFSGLSITGGIVDALKCVALATQLSGL